MLRRFTAPAALALLMLGCSDPAPAPAKAALAFAVAPPSGGGSCPATGIQYSLPSGPDALNAIKNTGGANDETGDTYRVVDGKDGAEVSCRVAQTSDTEFDFSARLRKGNSVNFYARGTLTTTGGTIEVSEWDNASGLSGTATGAECTVDLVGPPTKYIAPGAVWAAFSCPDFSENLVQCRSEGTFIFENCDQ